MIILGKKIERANFKMNQAEAEAKLYRIKVDFLKNFFAFYKVKC